MLSELLDLWGVSFFFYDIVELFVPSVEPGYRRVRWSCVSSPSWLIILKFINKTLVVQYNALGGFPRR